MQVGGRRCRSQRLDRQAAAALPGNATSRSSKAMVIMMMDHPAVLLQLLASDGRPRACLSWGLGV